jgi:hypothetical protein
MSEPAAAAALPGDPVTEAATSLDTRHFAGELDTPAAGWFRRFPAKTQTYQDLYLLAAPESTRGNGRDRRMTGPCQWGVQAYWALASWVRWPCR